MEQRAQQAAQAGADHCWCRPFPVFKSEGGTVWLCSNSFNYQVQTPRATAALREEGFGQPGPHLPAELQPLRLVLRAETHPAAGVQRRG